MGENGNGRGPGAGGEWDGGHANAGDAAGYRDFKLTTFAVGHRTMVLVLLFIISVLGIGAYRSVPKEASPEITIPMISVSTIYPGVAPKDMETLVTRVIEEELNTIAELTTLTSTSVEGYSNVTAEFDVDMDMEAALQEVREKVDLARPDLPPEAEEPIISEFNFSEFPIMQVNVSGEYGLVRLKEVAEDLQDRLEQIPALLDVRLSGGLEREVEVAVDLPRLKYYGLAFGDVIDAIRDEHVNVPGGGIDVGSREVLVRVDGEFEDPAAIGDIVVATNANRPIYLRDLARVDFGFTDRESYARLDGNPVVTLDIIKRSGENIIETADAVRAAIDELQPSFPPSTVVKITADASEDIHIMVSNLENNIISGLILVLAILLFFLGVRNASFVASSIPLSMLISFVIMQALGMSMNMIVLFSLILALGMLVDNAIVVVENIYRYMEEGHDNTTAAIRATGEVAMPIIGSTATTVAAFLPLLFWPGMVGEFMSFLPVTLIITLSSSLFAALVIVPVLCALFMKLDGAPAEPLTPAARRTLIAGAVLALLIVALNNVLTAVLFAATAVGLVLLHRTLLARAARWFQNVAVVRTIARYERGLRWALRHRIAVMGGTVALLIASVMAFGVLNAGVEFFPEDIPPAMVFAQVEVPSGTDPDFTNDVAERLEATLATIPGVQDAEAVVATVGTGGNMFMPAGDATITVSFKDFDQRTHDVFETLRIMQQELGREIAGAEVTVEVMEMGPPAGKPVNVEIVGEDSEVLKGLAERAIAVLEASPVYPKLEGLESDMEAGRPELVVEVDREKAALYGLSTIEVGTMVRSAIQGAEAAKFRVGEEEYDIVVRLAEPYRNDLDALQDFQVVVDGRQIPLPSVASWHLAEGFGTVLRKDMDRVATVSSDVHAGENSNAVLAGVQQALAGFADGLPRGYSLRYTGAQEEQQESQEFLSGAFLVALMLIALILVAQFNSVVKPFIIMTSVILSTIGVLLGLILFRMPFGIIMTGLGVISLAGVVVNNAIVLIDYIDILRERDGMSRREALVQAGMTRFRPVILTAITTVLGLVPLAIGLNFDFLGLYTALAPNIFWGGEQAAWWGPMAIAVIVGLSFATFLTLVLVPVMYSIVDDISDFFRRHYTRGGGAPAGAEDAPHAEPAAARTTAEPVPVPAAFWSKVRARLRPRSVEG